MHAIANFQLHGGSTTDLQTDVSIQGKHCSLKVLAGTVIRNEMVNRDPNHRGRLGVCSPVSLSELLDLSAESGRAALHRSS